MLRHIVLFRLHDDVADADVDRAITELRALGSLPSVSAWRVERSSDTRKGRILVEDATFASASDFETFRRDPAHVAAAAMMAEISDWWNGDYVS